MNYASHFQSVSRRQRRFDFGTIAGFHTCHELSELIDNLDGFVQEMKKTIESGWASWNEKNPTEAQAWKDNWEVFYPRWYTAVQKARTAVGSQLLWDVTTAEPDYQALLIVYNPGPNDPFGFPALDRTLRAAVKSGAPEGPTYHAKQPDALDIDSTGLQVSTIATDAMPDWMKQFVGTIAPGLVPKTKDEKSYKPFATPNQLLIGVAVGVAGIVALKILL